jgi:hypothetical protein
MGKEDNILRKVGTKNPFQVPDHYFDEVVQEVMARLPEKAPVQPIPEPTTWQRIKPWIYMAAMFCGIMLSVRIFVGEPQKDKFPITQAEAEMLPGDEWEIMVRRTLMDDYELYEYLTENK